MIYLNLNFRKILICSVTIREQWRHDSFALLIQNRRMEHAGVSPLHGKARSMKGSVRTYFLAPPPETSHACWHYPQIFTGLPSSRDGTRLSDSALTCAVGLRLGADVAAASTCVSGALLDSHGDHALSYSRDAGRHARHRNKFAILKGSRFLRWRFHARTNRPRRCRGKATKRGHRTSVFAWSRDGVGRDSFKHVRAHLHSLNCQQSRCSRNACRNPQGK